VSVHAVARLVASLLIASTAWGCVRYQPQPLDPARHPAELRARRLDDPGLLEWMRPYAGAPQGRQWTDRQLAVAALGWRTELARARAEWRAALAGTVTAGERPSPGGQAEVERRVGGRKDGAPWVVSLAALTTVELGGKRGARLLAARARTAVAESRLVTLAAELAAQSRAATLALAASQAEVGAAAAAVAELEQISTLEQRRYAEAALASSELARTRTEVQDARAELARAEMQLAEARAGLAAAVGAPVAAVANIEPAPTPTAGCARLDGIGVDSLVGLALVRRPEVATALAGYAEAEAGVRLEVARLRPDLEIGPGFIWDQGVRRWTLGLALPALLGLRHRGALGEAEAERTVAAQRVAEAQDSVVMQVESAAERCRGARLAVTAADSVVAAERAFADRAKAAYQRGETARLDPARAELSFARAVRMRAVAERAAVLAGITLEAAAAMWPDGDAHQWPDPREEQPAR
jgi:outer membrane protein, heavy metal efflux system